MLSKIPLSHQNIRSLFLATVFPIHFWAILLFILEAPNPGNANLQGEAFAIGAYILIYALFESILVSLALFLLTFLLPSRWTKQERFGSMLALLILILIGSLLAQLSTLIIIPDSPFFLYLGINLANTLLYRQIAFLLLIILVVASVIAAIVFGKRWGAGARLQSLVDRVAPLSILYLALDFAALILVISRNT